MRLIIAALLTLALAGCDKCKQDQPQEQASIARIDRSLAGQEAPATPFLRPQEQPVTLAAFRGNARQSVVEGQSVSVRVDLGRRGIVNTHTNTDKRKKKP